ncbi:MAG: SRPBCC family protein [Deltaproteobacteria bacterium]|nr:SRPBCC family protein [Deltaproteobacteria bacterium]
MKALKFLFIGLFVLGLLFVVVGLALPKEYVVERTVTIDAPPVIAFAQVNDLRAWEKWSPWMALDPDMKITYGDKTLGAGASYSWEGKESGSGTLTIKGSQLGERIDTHVNFGPQGEGDGFWLFEKDGAGSKVTWGMRGRNAGPFGGWFGLIIDDMLGPQFEEGLAGVKKLAEAEAKTKPAIGSALEQVLKQAGQELGSAIEDIGRQ